MNKTIHQTSLKSLLANAAVCAAVLLMAGQAQGETVYRVVGPDGKVTFSDKPPAASDNATATEIAGTAVATTGVALPFALRQLVSKYPVTLYTSGNCTPCDSGRALLGSRGVPFAEKTVNTPDDSDALRRISSESALPFLTIGGQQIKGFSDPEWTQFLDAAGYPKSSVLPASYRNPAAAPLVAVQKPAPSPKPEETPRAPAEPSPPAVDSASNPAGIRF